MTSDSNVQPLVAPVQRGLRTDTCPQWCWEETGWRTSWVWRTRGKGNSGNRDKGGEARAQINDLSRRLDNDILALDGQMLYSQLASCFRIARFVKPCYAKPFNFDSSSRNKKRRRNVSSSIVLRNLLLHTRVFPFPPLRLLTGGIQYLSMLSSSAACSGTKQVPPGERDSAPLVPIR